MVLWLICDVGKKRGRQCVAGRMAGGSFNRCFYTADKTKWTWDRRDKMEGTVDRRSRWGAGGRAPPRMGMPEVAEPRSYLARYALGSATPGSSRSTSSEMRVLKSSWPNERMIAS